MSAEALRTDASKGRGAETASFRLGFVASLALLLSVAPAPRAVGASDGAHFWLSTAASGVSGPEAPTVPMTVGDTQTIHIWGRPRAGRQLQSISLNLIADDTGLDLVDGSFAINNAIGGGPLRFEFVRDASTTPTAFSEYSEAEVTSGDADELYGLNAFNLFGGPPTYLGMGPTCGGGETDCEIAGDGEPAWRIASFDVKAVATSSGVDVRLQIGDRGMLEQTLADGDYDFSEAVDAADQVVWASAFGSTTELAADGTGDGVVDAADYTLYRDNFGATASLGAVMDTDVRFGVDPGAGDEPLHNAATDKETNLVGDDADLIVTIAAAPSLSVPEPGSAALAVLAGVFAVGRRLPTRAD